MLTSNTYNLNILNEVCFLRFNLIQNCLLFIIMDQHSFVVVLLKIYGEIQLFNVYEKELG